jgi:hypothetical protein
VCHLLKRTKPCVEYMTSGEVKCRWCEADIGTLVMGYQPLYTQLNGKSVYELLHDDDRDNVDAIPLHNRVLVGRQLPKGSTIYVMNLLDQNPPWITSDPERLKPAEILVSLLKMWKIPELSHWWTTTQGRELPPNKVEQTPATEVGRNITEGIASTLTDWGGVALGERVSEVDRLKRHAAAIDAGERAARNGKPKPKPSE